MTVQLVRAIGGLTHARRLFDLGIGQQERYECFGELSDIHNSISNLLRAVQLTDDGHQDKPLYMSGLSSSQRYRFERLGEMYDIEDSISTMLQAVQLTNDGHENKPRCFSTLGVSQFCRFQRLGDLTDINDAISNLLQAVQLTEDGQEDKSGHLSNLGGSQLRRFELLGEAHDIHASIRSLLHAVQLTQEGNPEKPMCLSNLGISQLRRFECIGEMSDIEDSISSLLRAVELTDDEHPNKAMYLANLGLSQMRRFERLGEVHDIQASIRSLLDAVQLTQEGHPDKALYLSNLSVSQRSRFECLGAVSDIDDSISCLLRAVQLTDDDHLNKASYLANLGASRLRRFERLGEVHDIQASIHGLLHALQLTEDGHPNKPMYLSNIGNVQRRRFDCLGEMSDIEDSISSSLRAVQLTDDEHPNKATYLVNLGASQLRRFERLGEVHDIQASIHSLLHAVQLTEDGHPNKPMYLSDLGISQNTCFKCLGETPDMEDSISSLLRAVELTDDEHPNKATYLANLGGSLLCRFEQLGRPEDLISSVSSYREAAQSRTAYPRQALSAAREWADISHQHNDFSSALEGYQAALQILPQVAWLGLEATSRQDELLREQCQGLDCLAATCAIQSGHLQEGVELLDLGRSVFWRQAASLRGDLELLREVKSALAGELEGIGRLLDAGNFSGSLLNAGEQNFGADLPSQEDTGAQRRRLVSSWEKLIDQVRQLPGFENFLKPLPFHQLRQVVTEGQVVIINASLYGVDALIFGATGPITHVPLPDIDLESLTKLSGDIVLKRPTYASVPQRQNYANRYLKPALRTIWEQVLIPIFDTLQISPGSNAISPQHRIWWYPTGPLAFVPIHAAGPGRGGIDVSRIVISSYVPTLESLFRAKQKSLLGSVGAPKFLTISQPNTPGQSSLPRATAEAETVVGVVSMAGWLKEDIVPLNGLDATVDCVSVALDSCSYAHFACHGIQHPTFGIRSAFALQDGNLELGQIVSKRLTNAQFAFLSICHAATGLKDLPGEAMHLAGGLQFAGFSSVIATMWSISDEDAPKVAAYTYEYLFRDGLENLDHSDAAVALNRAVLRLREDPEVTLDKVHSILSLFVHSLC